MARPKTVFARPTEKYFDVLLTKELIELFPEFLHGKIPEWFENQIVIPDNLGRKITADFLSNFALKHGIEFRDIANYLFFQEEQYHLLLIMWLSDSSSNISKIDLSTLTTKGKKIGQMVLNELNDFPWRYKK